MQSSVCIGTAAVIPSIPASARSVAAFGHFDKPFFYLRRWCFSSSTSQAGRFVRLQKPQDPKEPEPKIPALPNPHSWPELFLKKPDSNPSILNHLRPKS